MWALIEEFLGFIVEVLLVRHVRKKRGLAERAVSQDIEKVGEVYLWCLLASAIATAVIVVLVFIFNCSLFWSFILTAAPAGIWGGLKFTRLFRQ